VVRRIALFALAAVMAAPAHAQDRVVYRVPVTGTIELGIAPFIENFV